MEPASVVQALPSFQNLRTGQKAVVDIFGSSTSAVAQLPTGYGKTMTAVCCYLTLRERQMVNRVLMICPRGAQAAQAAEEVPGAIYRLGHGRTRAHVVGENPVTALKAHRRGEAEIFVVTIQSLVSSAATWAVVRELMSTGRWLVIVDEHHHYGNADDSVWTQKVTALPASALLAMSATPHRSDGPPVFGPPDVVVSYLDAWREGAVKELSLHAYEYRVDAINVNGDVIPFDTRELLDAVGSDNPQEIDKWLASKQMRWSPKYISPLIMHPVDRMADLMLKNVRAQMLVQALSCSHARVVCDQIKSLVPENMRVDWVGTGPQGRSDKENKEILEQFCPPKDGNGRRNWTLDVLVNVGIAGEGLDTTDVCEVVFLTSPNINNSVLQTIGRGARVIPGAREQPVCTINVDGASELAEFIGKKIMSVFDEGELTEEEEKESEERERADDYEPLPEKLTVSILDVTLLDIRKDPMFQEILDLNMRRAGDRISPEQVAAWTEDSYRDIIKRRDERFNASAIEAQTRDKINLAVRKVAGLYMRTVAAKSEMRLPTNFIGDILKRINTQKKRELRPIEHASAEELDTHYQWVKRLEAQILSGQVPSWLR